MTLVEGGAHVDKISLRKKLKFLISRSALLLMPLTMLILSYPNYFCAFLSLVARFCLCRLLCLDAAGKTTILYKLHIGEVLSTVPTIGELIHSK